jgi:hypothetical protein
LDGDGLGGGQLFSNEFDRCFVASNGFGIDLVAEVIDLGKEVGQRRGRDMLRLNPITAARLANVVGVDVLLEVAGFGNSQDGFTKVECFADELVARIANEGVTTGQMLKEVDFVDVAEVDVSFAGSLADTVDERGPTDSPESFDQAAVREPAEIDKEVVAICR